MSRGSLINRAITAFGWRFVTVALSGVSQLVTLIAIARFLTPAEVGQFGLAMIYVAGVSVLSKFGLGPALVHFDKVESSRVASVSVLADLFGVMGTSTLGLIGLFIVGAENGL